MKKPSAAAWETYLGIWNYISGGRQPPSLCKYTRKPAFSTAPPTRRHRRAFCQTAYTYEKNDVSIHRAVSEEQHIPASPNEGDTGGSEEPVGNYTSTVEGSSDLADLANYGTQHEKFPLPVDIYEKLKRYESLGRVVQTPHPRRHDWYTLRQLARGDALDHNQLSKEIDLEGFITSQRGNKSKGIIFYQLVDPHLRLTLQLVATIPKSKEKAGPLSSSDDIASGPAPDVQSHEDALVHRPWPDINPHTPVRVRGRIAARPQNKASPEISIAPFWLQGTAYGKYDNLGKYDEVATRLDPFVGDIYSFNQIEMHVSEIIPLNSFPDNLVAKVETNFPPEQRHLQLRTKANLRSTLRTRSLAAAVTRKFFFKQGFDEIETPLLFKSTPEGAREFVVPTRKPGMAYALPQSPQQYKQLLMASGIPRYFQLAKCFRDEDMRTDRQPEFTQLDLEMSFANRGDIMSIVEYLIAGVLWPGIKHYNPFPDKLEQSEPFYKWIPPGTRPIFPRLSYREAMHLYGSDKPDLRFQSRFKRVEEWISADLKAMLTSLDRPAIEMFKMPASDGGRGDVKKSSRFVGEFFDAPSSAAFLKNPAGAPGIAIFDPNKPLNGLAAFGHGGATRVEEIWRPEPGDIFIMQARLNTKLHTGGSTPLGNIRRAIFDAAVAQELLVKPTTDNFAWITNFPLFSPVAESEPGQGGSAGICSTHHPFTAPSPGQDLTKLYTDPLSISGDHYDLVINGVEVGGGSVRIHDAEIQELIFRDVLKMAPERIEDFRHLLDALKAGCPPHAGFALGFDRLMAVMLDKESVKDVIAFPKTAAGEDKFVGSPARLTPEQLETYHLAVKVPEKDGEAQI